MEIDCGLEKLGFNKDLKSIESQILEYFESQADIQHAADDLKKRVQDIAAAILDRRRNVLLEGGFPLEVIQLCKDQDKPFPLKPHVSKTLQKVCISSSNACRFRPWTGLEKRFIEGDKLVDYLEKIKVGGSKTSKDAEKKFSESCSHLFPGLRLMNSISTYLNPAVPQFIATPDFLLLGNLQSKEGIVEVKTTKDPLTIAQLKVQTSLNENYGIRFQENGSLDQIATLKRGHPWRAQLAVQAIVLRVRVAYLVMVLTDGFVIVKEEFQNSELHALIQNTWETHSQALLHLHSERLEDHGVLLQKRKGRPPRKCITNITGRKAQRQQHIFFELDDKPKEMQLEALNEIKEESFLKFDFFSNETGAETERASHVDTKEIQSHGDKRIKTEKSAAFSDNNH
jgi:hypothetical protein